MIAVGSIISLKMIQRSPFRQYSCSKTVQTSSTSSSSFFRWSEKWFNNKNASIESGDCFNAPVFYCDSKNIGVLKDPKQFYSELKVTDLRLFYTVPTTSNNQYQ